MKKIRFTIRATPDLFTPETLTAFAEIVMACGGSYAIRREYSDIKEYVNVVCTSRDTAKRLHNLAREFDAAATMTEG